jgi:hypothetical protein
MGSDDMRSSSKYRRPNRQAIAIEKTFPAPVGGWNARDPIGTAGPTDAFVLDNFYPHPSYVETRSGYTIYASNMQEDIQTLATCKLLNGSSILIVFFNTGVTLATFAGDYSGATYYYPSSRTVGRHQWTQFGDGTNTWTIAVNGADKPLYYRQDGVIVQVDGTSSPAITGPTTTDFISVSVFKNRLLFIRKDKLGFDYLPAGAAGGAASYFDLSPFASKGGYLMAATSWTRDAGDGPDDYAVFVTSEGEALVYAGTDPSSSTTWALVGVYYIGRPLGRKCFTRYGADPLILTESGLFPLSSLLMSGDERNKFALSFKIEDAFREAAKKYFNNAGWEVVSFPKEHAIIINVPIAENGRHDQYVMNTLSKAWCRFTGLNAEGFVLHKYDQVQTFDSQLLFYRGRQIFRAFTGASDNGDLITCEAQQAYMDFGTPQLKEPLMYMPVFTDANITAYQSGISTDFEDRSGFSSTTVQQSSAGRWGISKWGSAKWGKEDAVVRQWGAVAAWPGRWLSGKLKIASSSQAARWVGSVMRFNVGSGL